MKFFSSPSTTQAEPVVSTATSNKENQTPPADEDHDTGVEKSRTNNKDDGDETREDVSCNETKSSEELLGGMTSSLLQERWESFAERAINPGDDDDDDDEDDDEDDE